MSDASSASDFSFVLLELPLVRAPACEFANPLTFAVDVLLLLAGDQNYVAGFYIAHKGK